MTSQLPVLLEIGPKGKKVVAVAPGWPGLARGASSAEAAVERIRAYLPRYAPVAALAGLDADFAAIGDVGAAGEYPGTGSTDFWGISFAFSEIDHQPMDNETLGRHLALMRASWAFFDTVRGRVSAELRRGPRGGGRDRDKVVRHTLGVELDWASGIGVAASLDDLLAGEGLAAYRDSYCAAIRTLHAEGRMAKKWPLRYLIRHTAFHTLDHAWEMEDKDLTQAPA